MSAVFVKAPASIGSLHLRGASVNNDQPKGQHKSTDCFFPAEKQAFSAFTLAAWYFPEVWTGNEHVLMSYAEKASLARFITLRLDDAGTENSSVAQFNLRGVSGVTRVTSTVNTWKTREWQHVVGIYTTSTNRRCVLNGDWANSQTTTDEWGAGWSGTAWTDMQAVHGQFAGGSYNDTATGYLCIPAVWNKALSQSEVEALYAGALPTQVASENLVNYWPINYTGGGMYRDVVGKCHMKMESASISPFVPPHLHGGHSNIYRGLPVSTGSKLPLFANYMMME